MTAVRAATAADLDAVVALEESALGPDAWSRGLVAAGLSGDVPTVDYLAVDGPQGLTGYAVVSVAGDVAELQRIAVAAPARRRGLGAVLLAAAVGRARALGADRVLLEVREDNAGARAFYAASGFAELGVRQRYYGDGAAAVILERVLADGPDHDDDAV